MTLRSELFFGTEGVNTREKPSPERSSDWSQVTQSRFTLKRSIAGGLELEARPHEPFIPLLAKLGLCLKSLEPQEREGSLYGGRHQVWLEERKPGLIAWIQLPNLFTWL